MDLYAFPYWKGLALTTSTGGLVLVGEDNISDLEELCLRARDAAGAALRPSFLNDLPSVGAYAGGAPVVTYDELRDLVGCAKDRLDLLKQTVVDLAGRTKKLALDGSTALYISLMFDLPSQMYELALKPRSSLEDVVALPSISDLGYSASGGGIKVRAWPFAKAPSTFDVVRLCLGEYVPPSELGPCRHELIEVSGLTLVP